MQDDLSGIERKVSFDIKKDGKEIEQAFYSSNAYLEKCDGYLIVPIFYYKNQIHIDWANLENYGKCVIAPEMAEKTVSISKFDKEIAELAQKTSTIYNCSICLIIHHYSFEYNLY